MNILKLFEKFPFLPLVTIEKQNDIDTLIEIINITELPIIEIAYRSEFASEAIERISQETSCIIGAGTIRNVEQAKEAINKGAQFIVTPAVITSVLEFAIESGITIIPGALTPTEIQTIIDYDIHIIKIFPASVIGGQKGLKALTGPFPEVKMIPTGGVNDNNYLEYLKNDYIVAVGGSFIINSKELSKGLTNLLIANINKFIKSV